MQTIIRLNEVDFSFFEKLKKDFADKEVSLTITEIVKDEYNPKAALKRMQALQKKYPPKVISKDINLSELANEVNL